MSGGARITALSPERGEGNWQVVMIDGVRMATLPAAEVSRLQLCVGATLDEHALESIRQAEQIITVRKAALKFLGRRDYSRCDLLDRLVRSGLEPRIVQRVVDDLVEIGTIDDEKMARRICEHELERGAATARLLQQRLERYKIDATLAATVATDMLKGRDQVAAAMEFARARMKASPRIKPQQIAGRLARRGFDEETTLEVMRRLGFDDMGQTPLSLTEFPDDLPPDEHGVL